MSWLQSGHHVVNFFHLVGVSLSIRQLTELLFSLTVVSNSLQPHGLQHARLSCPSLSSGVCSDSCPLSWWCHPAISSSVTPFSSCPQYFPASEAFPMSWLFPSGGQSIGALASASREYSGLISFRTDWFDLLAVWGTLKSLLQHHSSKASVLWCSAFFMVQLSHLYMATGKTIVFTNWTFFGKVMSLLFNTLSRFASFNFKAAVILEPKKRKFVSASTFSPSICHGTK